MAQSTIKNLKDRANSPRQPERRLAVRTVNHRLVVSTLKGTFLIPFHEIKFCAASGNYCIVALESGKEVLLSKTLKFVQKQLPPSLFLRVHQSYLVNKDYVRFIGKNHLLLACESKVPVSRSRRAHVIRTLLG
jgi:two-component system LytT family response regulator